jgi:hypothetical protein
MSTNIEAPQHAGSRQTGRRRAALPALAGVAALAAIVGVGFLGAKQLHQSASQHDAWVQPAEGGNECAAVKDITSPSGQLTVTGLPTTIDAAFGYGRGTKVVDSTTFAVAAQAGVTLPDRLPLAVLPLVNTVTGREIRDVAAVAHRVPGTSTYQLRVCIDTDHVRAGAYQGSLLFTDTNVTSDISPLVSATLQNQMVPWILLVAGPFLVLLGIVYVSAIVVRRAEPAITLGGAVKVIGQAFTSLNGILALVAATGAAYSVWRLTINGNPTWGDEWALIPVSLVAVAGAAAAAATVPLGLSTKTVQEALAPVDPTEPSGADSPSPSGERAEGPREPASAVHLTAPPGPPANGSATAPARA